MTTERERQLQTALGNILCIQPPQTATVADLWLAIGEMRKICAEALTSRATVVDTPSGIVTLDEAEEVERIVEEFLSVYDVDLYDHEELFLSWSIYLNDPDDPIELTAGQRELAERVMWTKHEKAIGRA